MPAELLTKNKQAPSRAMPTAAVPANTGRSSQRVRHLYLASDQGLECPLLPAPLTALISRVGWTWVDPDTLLPHHRSWRKGDAIRDPGNFACPLREPGLLGKCAGLLWIDDARYPRPEDWRVEAGANGPSLRIATVPYGFVLGETWVLVAHRAALGTAPGIVHVFQPMRLDEIEVATAA
jgi:hypothetical protein